MIGPDINTSDTKSKDSAKASKKTSKEDRHRRYKREVWKSCRKTLSRGKQIEEGAERKADMNLAISVDVITNFYKRFCHKI